MDRWIGEDNLPFSWPVQQRPDAVLRSVAGSTYRAIEYGGDYSPRAPPRTALPRSRRRRTELLTRSGEECRDEEEIRTESLESRLGNTRFRRTISRWNRQHAAEISALQKKTLRIENVRRVLFRLEKRGLMRRVECGTTFDYFTMTRRGLGVSGTAETNSTSHLPNNPCRFRSRSHLIASTIKCDASPILNSAISIRSSGELGFNLRIMCSSIRTSVSSYRC